MDHLKGNVPTGCRLVGVELDPTAKDLTRYCHPAQAMYLLGHESSGLPGKVLAQCNDVVMIKGLRTCLNVATTGGVVLFDRLSKGVYSGK
jgi:tRNA G18 (ribose-2'-O)-methylase SpoU